MNRQPSTMIALGDSDQTVADQREDIRGRTVLDRDDNEIGKIDELLVDTEHKKVRFLRVKHGGLFGVGATPLFIPVEAVDRVTDHEVGIDRSRAQVADAPQYDPELVDRDKYLTDLYGHYGYSPYWTAGYRPPPSTIFR